MKRKFVPFVLATLPILGLAGFTRGCEPECDPKTAAQIERDVAKYGIPMFTPPPGC